MEHKGLHHGDIVHLLSENKIVALGRVHTTEPSDLCHGELLGNGFCSISIDKCLDIQAYLPFPTIDASMVNEVVGGFVKWDIQNVKTVKEVEMNGHTYAATSPNDFIFEANGAPNAEDGISLRESWRERKVMLWSKENTEVLGYGVILLALPYEVINFDLLGEEDVGVVVDKSYNESAGTCTTNDLDCINLVEYDWCTLPFEQIVSVLAAAVVYAAAPTLAVCSKKIEGPGVDKKFHLTETRQLLRFNYGRGGMKKVAEEILATKVSSFSASTYGMHILQKEEDFVESLWPILLKGKGTSNVGKKEFFQARNSIKSTTRWADLVDSLYVFAYITRAQANEAIVEDKRHREDDAPRPSKWPTRSSLEAQLPPAPKVTMEEATRTKKSGKPRGPCYKLKSDIEIAIDLKKVFKERIFNSKVEITLGEVLGIAKCKLHEAVIDIINHKSQVPTEQEAQPVQNQMVKIMESILDAYEEESNEEDDGELKSDIEIAIDLKKVFKERIFNSKVEITLGEVLGIAKCKLHEAVIDIINHKRQVPTEQEAQPVQNQMVKIMESILDAYEEESNEEDDGEVISYAHSSDVK
ncbi:hypothetical protein L7F22_054271 [Adiantum nelumboides]|nr:hypothetical protein [Adiantum nelumboides]